MQDPSASALVTYGIPGLAALVLASWALGVAIAECRLGSPRGLVWLRAFAAGAGGVAWSALCLLAAHSGLLARFTVRPPPLFVLLLITLLGAVLLGRSLLGQRLALGLPLWALVGFQAFRLPLELVLHRAARDGIMPIEMCFSGYNFDILSGASALLLAALLSQGIGLRLVPLWNLLGLLLLANIVTIAIAATPVFHAFGPDHLNTWVSRSPFVLLPSVLVMAALFGHVVVLRSLRMRRRWAAAQRLQSSASE
jgi:hypothetical protein